MNFSFSVPFVVRFLLLPTRVRLDHDIEYGDQFSHHGNDGDLEQFALLSQFFVKHLERRTILNRIQSRHIKCRSDIRPTASNTSYSRFLTAVLTARCRPHQRRNLAAIERSQL